MVLLALLLLLAVRVPVEGDQAAMMHQPLPGVLMEEEALVPAELEPPGQLESFGLESTEHSHQPAQPMFN
jgi:hypothetical protein